MKKYLLFILCTAFFSSAFTQTTVNWQHLGPDNMGGWVLAMLLDNRDPQRQTLYAAPSGGGLWKSTNKGDSWTKLPCLVSQNISSITQANDGTIYLATGFVNQCAPSFVQVAGFGYTKMQGIYRLDLNEHPILIPSTTNDSLFRCTSDLVVNPMNSQQLFVASYYGFLKSDNAGQSWDTIVKGDFSNSNIKFSSDGEVAYAALGRLTGSYRIYRYRKVTGDWQRLNSTDHPGFNFSGFGNTAIAFAPGNSSIALLQLSVLGINFGKGLAVIKTIDAGATWDTVQQSNPSYLPFPGWEGWLHNAIGVVGSSGDSLYFGGTNFYSFSSQTSLQKLQKFTFSPQPNVSPIYPSEVIVNELNPEEMYITSSAGVFRCEKAKGSFPNPNIYSINNNFGASFTRGIAASLSGKEFLTSIEDIGLAKGYNTSKAFSIETGVSGSSSEGISVIDTTSHFAVSILAKNFYKKRTLLGNWYDAYDANIRSTPMSVCGNNYAGEFYSKLYLAETVDAFKGRDSVTYISPSNKSTGDTIHVRSKVANYPFVETLSQPLSQGNALKFCDRVKSRIFLSLECGFFIVDNAVTKDSLLRWHKLSSRSRIRALDWSKDVDTVVFMFYNQLYRIKGINSLNFDSLYTTNDTIFKTPEQLVFPFSASQQRQAQCISLDKENANHFIVGAIQNNQTPRNYNLFKTEDGGQNWESFQVGDIGLSVQSCLIDIHNNNRYIVGTEKGIWFSEDRGYNWYKDNSDICETSVTELKQLPVEKFNCTALYAATSSAGVWRTFSFTPQGCNTSVAVKEIDNRMNSKMFSVYPNPVNDIVNVHSNERMSTSVAIHLYDLSGSVIPALFERVSESHVKIDTRSIAQGTYVISISTGSTRQNQLLTIVR